jgi:hypothetical protein
VKPEDYDTTSSPTTVYQRRNVKDVTLQGDDDAPGVAGWEYEERQLTRDEYNAQQAELESPATQMIMQTLSAIELSQEMMEV